MNKPSKAYANSSFLNSPDARPIRVQCELIEPSVRFAEQKVENTIVLFGSARSKDSTQAKKDLEALLEKLPEDPTQRTDEQTGEVLKKERILMLSVLRPRGRALPNADGGPAEKDPQKRHLICSGGGPGMMEAANKGAHRRRFIDCLGDQFTF